MRKRFEVVFSPEESQTLPWKVVDNYRGGKLVSRYRKFGQALRAADGFTREVAERSYVAECLGLI